MNKKLITCLLVLNHQALADEINNRNNTLKSSTVEEEMIVTAPRLGSSTEFTGSYTTGSSNTATKFDLTPKETPQTVSTITHQKMEDFNLKTIDKVLDSTPGIGVISLDSDRKEFFSRGFAIRSFQYDGMQVLYDPMYASGQTLSNMAIYDHVDILKGVSGLMTGTGSPGGTINLIRKMPTANYQGNVGIGYGSFGRKNGQIDLSGPLNDNGNIRARTVIALDEQKSKIHRYERNTDVFYGVIEADITDNTTASIGADYQNNKPKSSTWGGIAYFNTKGDFNNMPESFNNSASWSSMNQHSQNIFGKVEHFFNNDWKLNFQLANMVNGYDAEIGGITMGLPNPDTGSGTILVAGKYKGKTTYKNADLSLSGDIEIFKRTHNLSFGVSSSNRKWQNDGYNPQYYFVPDYYNWDGKIDRFNWVFDKKITSVSQERNLYAMSRWNLHDKLNLITGTRWVKYTSKTDNIKENGKLIPFFGLVYDLNNNISAYVSYSSIFMPQSERDADDKTLPPKNGSNKEVGIKSDFFNGQLNSSIVYFDILQNNLPEVDSSNAKLSFKPVNGVQTKGLEVEVAGQVTPNMQVHTGYTHAVSHKDGMRTSTTIPANMFKLYTTYELTSLINGVTIGAGVRWNDKTWGDPIILGANRNETPRASQYWVTDAMINYKINKSLSANLNITNVFNTKNYTIFREYGQYTYGESRGLDLKIKYDF